MSETHEKRARAQSKKMKQKDKAVRKEQRREQGAVPAAPDAVEARYYSERDRESP
jgi:hypothetical protein